MNHSNDDCRSKPYEEIPPLDLERIPLNNLTEVVDFKALRKKHLQVFHAIIANLCYRLADDFLWDVNPHKLGLINDPERDRETVKEAIRNHLCRHYVNINDCDYYEWEIFSIILENLMKRDETLFQISYLSSEVSDTWVKNLKHTK